MLIQSENISKCGTESRNSGTEFSQEPAEVSADVVENLDTHSEMVEVILLKLQPQEDQIELELRNILTQILFIILLSLQVILMEIDVTDGCMANCYSLFYCSH